jgi:hypothetical protein
MSQESREDRHCGSFFGKKKEEIQTPYLYLTQKDVKQGIIVADWRRIYPYSLGIKELRITGNFSTKLLDLTEIPEHFRFIKFCTGRQQAKNLRLTIRQFFNHAYPKYCASVGADGCYSGEPDIPYDIFNNIYLKDLPSSLTKQHDFLRKANKNSEIKNPCLCIEFNLYCKKLNKWKKEYAKCSEFMKALEEHMNSNMQK